MAGGEHYRAVRADSRRIGPVYALVSGQQGELSALRAIPDNTVMGHIGDIERAMLIDHDAIAIPADLTRWIAILGDALAEILAMPHLHRAEDR